MVEFTRWNNLSRRENVPFRRPGNFFLRCRLAGSDGHPRAHVTRDRLASFHQLKKNFIVYFIMAGYYQSLYGAECLSQITCWIFRK